MELLDLCRCSNVGESSHAGEGEACAWARSEAGEREKQRRYVSEAGKSQNIARWHSSPRQQQWQTTNSNVAISNLEVSAFTGLFRGKVVVGQVVLVDSRWGAHTRLGEEACR